MTLDLSREIQAEGISVWTLTDTFAIGAYRLAADRAREELEDDEARFCIGLGDVPCEVTVEGEGWARAGPELVRLHQPGDRLLTRKAADDPWAQTWIVLSEELLQGFDADRLFATSFLRPGLRHLAAMRFFFARVEAGECPLWVEESLAEALQALLTLLPGPQSRARSPTPRERNLALQADERLARDFFKPLKLSAIARELGVTAPYLARSYRSTLGGPMHERLMSLRLAAALVRLADGVDDLTALALDLGFASHSHFTTAFHRRVGVPPNRYRAGICEMRGVRYGAPRVGR